MVAVSQLPPLILHPFSGGGSTDELLEGSRASLALQGLVPIGAVRPGKFGPGRGDGRADRPAAPEDESELLRRVLAGRYQEIRMLLFLGKDLFRWMQQCVDCVQRSAPASGSFHVTRITEQSFAALVVENPSATVEAKLRKWGVSDRRAIFSRAIGINSPFNSPPPVDTLSHTFLQNYHRYADHAYICFQHLKPFHVLDASQFAFEMYASEEYAKLLSEQWERV